MNYLALVNRLRRKCGVTSSADVTTLTGLPEEMNRLADWVNEAWMDIQLKREDWMWMRKSFSFTTTNGQVSYTPTECGITDFGNWATDSIRNYVTASGTSSEIFMDYQGYEQWRNLYQFSANRGVYTRPIRVAFKPSDFSLCPGPIAASGYTILGDYYCKPSEMSATTDEPLLPARYHMAIIYRAMMFYGAFEAAQEVFNEGEAEFNRMMHRINRNQLPDVTMGGPLA